MSHNFAQWQALRTFFLFFSRRGCVLGVDLTLIYWGWIARAMRENFSNIINDWMLRLMRILTILMRLLVDERQKQEGRLQMLGLRNYLTNIKVERIVMSLWLPSNFFLSFLFCRQRWWRSYNWRNNQVLSRFGSWSRRCRSSGGRIRAQVAEIRPVDPAGLDRWLEEYWVCVFGYETVFSFLCTTTTFFIFLHNRADSIPAMRTSLPRLRNQLATDPEYFRKVYNYTFDFARSEGQRSLS